MKRYWMLSGATTVAVGIMAGPLGLPALTQAQAEDAVAGCVRELIDYGVTPNVAAEACTQQQSGTLRPSSPSIQKSPSVPKVPRPSNQPATAVAQPTPPPTTTTEPTTDPSALAFSCQSWEGQPTTMVRTQRGLLPLIVWKSAYFSNSGFTPESRCEIVSSRFQHHAERDNLRFISHGKLNAQKVLCVADRQALSSNSHNYECQAPLSGSLLLTLEATDDPETVLSELFAVASRANWGAVVFRGGNRFGVDLEEVLESREPISANLE